MNSTDVRKVVCSRLSLSPFLKESLKSAVLFKKKNKKKKPWHHNETAPRSEATSQGVKNFDVCVCEQLHRECEKWQIYTHIKNTYKSCHKLHITLNNTAPPMIQGLLCTDQTVGKHKLTWLWLHSHRRSVLSCRSGGTVCASTPSRCTHRRGVPAGRSCCSACWDTGSPGGPGCRKGSRLTASAQTGTHR